ncbi:MAG: hypothetical protein WAZ18_01535, partial [Alphaproteobacteria bacterium]
MSNEPSLMLTVMAWLACVGLWASAGKHLLRHTQSVGFTPTLAPSVMVGMGLWMVVWVLVVPLGGGHAVVAAAVFAMVTFMLALPTLRLWARERSVESHFMTLAVLQSVVLAPWLLILPLVHGVRVEDFEFIQVLGVWKRLGAWPVSPTDVPVLESGFEVGQWLPLLLPLVVDKPSVALPVLMNLTAVLLAAGWVTQVRPLTLRWSNALWVAVVGVAVVLP